jgi:hypothetical protein
MNETKFLKVFHALLIERGWLSFPQNSNVAPGSRYIPGTPDIIACSPGGRFFGFELKTAEGRVTKSQERMAAEFEQRGLAGSYLIVRVDNDWRGLVEGLE